MLRPEPRRVQDLRPGGHPASGMRRPGRHPRGSLDRQGEVVEAGRVKLELLLLERLAQAERLHEPRRPGNAGSGSARRARPRRGTALPAPAGRRRRRRTRASARGRGRRRRHGRGRRALRPPATRRAASETSATRSLVPDWRAPSSSVAVPNGHATASVSAPVSAASRTRSSLMPLPRSSSHMCAPPAPQQNVYLPVRFISTGCPITFRSLRGSSRTSLWRAQVARVVVGDRLAAPPSAAGGHSPPAGPAAPCNATPRSCRRSRRTRSPAC